MAISRFELQVCPAVGVVRQKMVVVESIIRSFCNFHLSGASAYLVETLFSFFFLNGHNGPGRVFPDLPSTYYVQQQALVKGQWWPE